MFNHSGNEKCFMQDGVSHILDHQGSSSNGIRAYSVCRKYQGGVLTEKIDNGILPIWKQPPTCPDCIREFFCERNCVERIKNVECQKNEKRQDSIICEAFNAIVNTGREVSVLTRDEQSKNGSFPFIPISTLNLVKVFLDLRDFLTKELSSTYFNASGKIFLDAGCGIGNVLILAQAVRLAERFDGIEYFDKTFKQAKSLLGIPKDAQQRAYHKFHVYKEDILVSKRYDKYDFIYYYCPFCNAEKQQQFEERVEDEMKVGAILIAFLKKSFKIMDDKRFERLVIDNNGTKIYRKVKNIKIYYKAKE